MDSSSKGSFILLRDSGLRDSGGKTGNNHRKISYILSTTLPRNTTSRNKLHRKLPGVGGGFMEYFLMCNFRRKKWVDGEKPLYIIVLGF